MHVTDVSSGLRKIVYGNYDGSCSFEGGSTLRPLQPGAIQHK
jgi:hypothetical protein